MSKNLGKALKAEVNDLHRRVYHLEANERLQVEMVGKLVETAIAVDSATKQTAVSGHVCPPMSPPTVVPRQASVMPPISQPSEVIKPINLSVEDEQGAISTVLRFEPGPASRQNFSFRLDERSMLHREQLDRVELQVLTRGGEQMMSVSITLCKMEGGPDLNPGEVAGLIPKQGASGGGLLSFPVSRGPLFRGDLKLTGHVTQHAEIKDEPVDVVVMARACVL